MNPVHILTPCVFRIHFNISFHLRLGLSSSLFLSKFHTKILYSFLTCPMLSTCSAHLILLYFITLVVSGVSCKLWSSFLCSLLHPPATSSLLGSDPVIVHHQPMFSVDMHIHINQQVIVTLPKVNTVCCPSGKRLKGRSLRTVVE
jgi:hypothetical protein